MLVGAALGALLGRSNQCKSGACPLTANWKRGAVYGAAIGVALFIVFGGSVRPYPETAHLKKVSEADFDSEIATAGMPVVVDFYAPWCGPCKVLAPRLNQLASEFNGRIAFMAVNVDEAPHLAERFNVQGIPTLLFIDRDGTNTEKTVGIPSDATLRAKLESLSKSEK